MSGLDFSAESLDQARRIATLAHADVSFVEADVYAAREALQGDFDLVFTGVGALCWVSDIDRWAGVVASLLAPGGRLFVREGHPMLWAIDETREELVVGYPYFETAEALPWTEEGTYVETDVEVTNHECHNWNHGLGEIITALADHGLRLTGLVEHTSVPWEALPGRMTKDEYGEWSLTEHPELVPLSYTLQAVREDVG